jgi:hypothetical protein
MIDLIREKMIHENQLTKQKVIGEALRNYESALRIRDRIKDPHQRKIFEENLSYALQPFVDGTHPKIQKMEIGLPD